MLTERESVRDEGKETERDTRKLLYQFIAYVGNLGSSSHRET
jgi:hypothetical protein